MSQKLRDIKINIDKYIYNANIFSVLVNMLLIINIIYLVMFLVCKQYLMAVCDAGLIIYLATAMKKKDENDRNTEPQMLCLLCCVYIYCVLGSIMLGTESGFNILLLAIIPVCFFVEYLMLNRSSISYVATAVVLITNIVMVYRDSIYEQGGRTVTYFSKWIMIYNLTIAGIIIVYATSIFMAEVFTISNGLERQNKMLSELASYDPLTGLLLRRPFMEQLDMSVGMKRTYGTDYSICIGDIDFFKKFNDNYGHECGDMVLKQVAAAIRKGVRECDSVCRWGGEEIIILFPNTSVYEAVKIMDRVRSDIEGTSHVYKGQIVNVTMTFGVSSSEKHIMSNDIIESADRALYKGKESGRNRVESC